MRYIELTMRQLETRVLMTAFSSIKKHALSKEVNPAVAKSFLSETERELIMKQMRLAAEAGTNGKFS